MNKIKFRRGSLNNKKNIDIEDGEPIYLTDTKRLYVSNDDVAINNVYVGTQEPNDPGINVWINPEGINNVVDMIYPIGSIYLSVNNVNPSSVFGGTWEAWGSGKVPVGVDTTQTEFNTVEKTGGEKEHKLTIEQIPEHDHPIPQNFGTPAQSSTDYTENEIKTLAATKDASYLTRTGKTGVRGGGKAHNNLQPYITCYMWKRIG